MLQVYATAALWVLNLVSIMCAIMPAERKRRHSRQCSVALAYNGVKGRSVS